MMARRLNKKVALIGSGVFLLLLVAAIAVILQLGQSPEEYINDAEFALQAAHHATDEQTKEQSYERAKRSLQKAFGKAKTNSLREQILFRLADMYLETGDWNYVVGCWDQIVKVNPNNAKARYRRLKYFYLLADSGSTNAWQQVQKQASEFLSVAEKNGLLTENTTQWDVPGMEEDQTGTQRLGPYLYLLRGRAALEMAGLGTVTNPDEVLAQAVEDLKKVQQLDPNNIQAYLYQARAIVTKGQILASRGSFEERDKAGKQAVALLEQAVQRAKSDPSAQIDLLMLKLKLAADGGAAKLKEQIQSLEPQYLSLVSRFKSSAKAFEALSTFYSQYSVYAGPRLSRENLDKAIEAAEKAMQLDAKNVGYAINAASLHYRSFSIYGNKPQMDKATEVAKNALTLPGAQETSGPRQRLNRLNRYRLYALLANCYIEQILDARGTQASSQTKAWLAGAEDAVHQIEQVFGSGDDPLVAKWKGMLQLAKGDNDAAVRTLYSAYEQLKAVMPPQPPWPRDMELAQLSYTLAGIFENTSETGAVLEFLTSAIYSGISDIKPQAYLDYVNALLALNYYSEALKNIDAFDRYFGSSRESRELRIRTYIGTKQFGDAEKKLAEMPPNDPNTVRLRLALTHARVRDIRLKIRQEKKPADAAVVLEPKTSDVTGLVDAQMDVTQSATKELNDYSQREGELLAKLLALDPNSVEQATMVSVCGNLIALGKTELTRNLVQQYAEHFPDNPVALVYKRILSEPDPAKVSQQRLKEIEEQALSGIPNPMARALELGIFYHRHDELEKATVQLRTAFETGISQKPGTEGAVSDRTRLAASHLFDIALETKNWELAEEVTKAARSRNLDDCQGQIFAARLALAKGQLQDALVRADDCLKQKPVFSYAYMLRSEIQAALGNEHASMEDIRKAAFLNPMGGTIARELASALYARNQKLGSGASAAQVSEAKDALLRALALNPGDLALQGLYADYIATSDPLRAVAIRQNLLQSSPSMENAVLLGKLATEAAAKEADPQKKEALFAVAGSAFEQAKKIDPRDERMLYYYAKYFRTKGQPQAAQKLLLESQNRKLLWDHYVQTGQYQEAKKVLEQLYDSGTKDSSVLKGLLLVAEKTSDREAVKKYSDALVALDNTAQNNLSQIQSFLKVGLIKEAEYKLQSFKEKYPSEHRAVLLQAWLLMREGRLEKALELANKNLQAEPDNATAWRLKGQIDFVREHYDQAISDFTKSKTLADEPSVRIALARTYLLKEQYEDALTELKTIMDSPGFALQARSLLEQIYLRLDRKPALKALYDQTVEQFPENANWLERAGTFAIRIGEFDNAEQLFKKALDAGGGQESSGEKTGATKDALYATALDGYLRALIAGAGTPNTKGWNPAKLDTVFEEGRKHIDGQFAYIAYLRMAQAKLVLGDRAAAAEYCRKAIEKAGDNEILATDVLLKMRSLLGNKEVYEYCNEKLQANPNSLSANLAMFNLARISGDYDKAINYIDKCIKLAGSDDTRRVDYTMKKGDVLISAYDKSSDKAYLRTAIAEYESLLAKMPNNTSVTAVLNNLAYVLAENSERLPEALEYAKKALNAKPDSPVLLDTYAYVLLKNGKVSEAAESLAAALQQFEQDGIQVPAEVYEHKGMIKEKQGAKAEALAAYKQALIVGRDKLSQKVKQRIEEAVSRVSL
jgi:tetratricopeptide (TPR) repeat protein